MPGVVPSPRVASWNASALYPALSLLYSHSSALFCTFLPLPKTQLSCFQSIPHSLQKKTRTAGDCRFFKPSIFAHSLSKPVASRTVDRIRSSVDVGRETDIPKLRRGSQKFDRT